MVTLLALTAAFAYGVADFLGGAAARRATALRALLVSVPSGLLVLIVSAIVAGGAPTARGLAWGLASGLAGGTGLITFYRALARGPMSVVAPVSALAAAVLPVVVGTIRGERLDAKVLVGVALCMIAIGLVSMEENKPIVIDEDRPATEARPSRAVRVRKVIDSGPLMAAFSGAAFGVFFVFLHEADNDSGLWPTAASRAGGLGVVLLAFLVLYVRRRTRSEAVPRRTGLGALTITIAVISGFLDGVANISYFLAAREGVMSLAAVLTSLYPAITVLLARMFYSERLRVVQRVGLAVAIAGVALVTVG